MITVKKATRVNYNNTPSDTIDFEFYGLNSDTKPDTTYEGSSIRNGSSFYEMDTKKVFLYDAENEQWLEQ